MTMKKLLLTVAVLFSTQANALQYPATCRGPTATVAGIEGFDTPKAKLVAIYTNPDMIAYCNYALRSENPEKKPDAAAVMKCAREFNETNGKTNLSVEANCKAGTMRMSELKEPIKMPVWTDCASRGQQIVTLFRMLCPAYTGATERQGKTFSEGGEKEPD